MKGKVEIDRRYRAYIAYSHRDRQIGDRIFKKLDGYRPPKELQGIESRFGPIPEKLHPVFRDREELAATDSVSLSLQSALRRSDCLVVLCSLAAAKSLWVNSEIRYFAEFGDRSRIYTVVVDGEPPTVFPPALAEIGHTDPLAADLRDESDGWKDGVLKLISGILGVGFGELKDREKIRRYRNVALASAVSAAVVVTIAVTGSIAYQNFKAAEQSQIESHVLDGQRELGLGNLQSARKAFIDALHIGDTKIGRDGLLNTFYSPLKKPYHLEVKTTDGVPAELAAVEFFDESSIVVGDHEGFVRVFDLEQRIEVWKRSVSSRVNSIAFNAEKGVIAVGSDSGEINLLDRSGEIIQDPIVTQSRVVGVRYSPDGNYLAVGSESGLQVFDETGQVMLDMLHDHAGTVQGLSFNISGDFIYWGGSGSYLWYCEITGGCNRMVGVDQWVYSIDGSPSGRFTAYSEGGVVEFFDHALQKRQRLVDSGGHIFSIRFDPNGRFLAVGASDHQLSFYDIRAQKLVAMDNSHSDQIYDLAFSPDGSKLVAVDSGGQISVRDVVSRGGVVRPHPFNPTDAMLAARQKNRISDIRVAHAGVAIVRTWDQESDTLIFDTNVDPKDNPQDEASFANAMAISVNIAKTDAWHSSEYSPAALWSVGTRRGQFRSESLISLIEGERLELVSPDREVLGVIGRKGAVFLSRNTKEPQRISFENELASAGSFDASGKRLILGFDDGKISFYDIENGEAVISNNCDDTRIRYILPVISENGFLVVSSNSLVCQFDSSGNLINKRSIPQTDAVSISLDGQLFATAGLTGNVVLFQTSSLDTVGEFTGHRGAVHALHFSESGDQLLSGGADETLRVWPAKEAYFIRNASIRELRKIYKD